MRQRRLRRCCSQARPRFRVTSSRPRTARRSQGPIAIARPSAYIIEQIDREQWPALLARFDSHSLFHTLPWMAAMEAEHAATTHLAAARIAHGEYVALWPSFTARKGPVLIQGSPVPGWNTHYMGPVFHRECDAFAALSAFLRHDAFRLGSYFSCKVNCAERPIDLSAFGFSEVERLDTYRLNLQRTAGELWDNLKSECRTRIRKASKVGLEVRHENDASFIDEFWTMANETFGVCGVKPTFTRSCVETIWNHLHPLGRIRVMSAMLEGRRVATLILPFDHHTMYYWAGGSFLEHRTLPAHNLLHWEAIAHAHALGLRYYDFVSATGNAGRFKSTFGPELVHIATTWERTPSLLMRAMRDGYQAYRDLRQRKSA